MVDEQSKQAEEFSWPNRKDRPFTSKPPQKRQPKPVPTSPTQEMFQHMQDQQWDYQFREGYFWAGENLARDLLEREALEKADIDRRLDGVYLPMLYCYRHYLEVSLKYLVTKTAALMDEPIKLDLDREHGLMPVWNELKRQMTVAFGPPDAENDTPRNVERSIKDFHDFDPNSQTFRYRFDTAGRPNEDRVPSADLRQLMRTMRGLQSYFVQIEGVADQAEENQAEWRSQLPQDYE